MKNYALPLIFLSSLALAGCISQKQADEKLQAACAAGVKSQLEEDYSIESVEQAAFSDTNISGSDARKIDLKLAINDGFSSESQEYACTFFVVFGPFNMNMNASIYQLQMPDGTIIGQDGLQAMGTSEQIDALNNAVSTVIEK